MPDEVIGDPLDEISKSLERWDAEISRAGEEAHRESLFEKWRSENSTQDGPADKPVPREAHPSQIDPEEITNTRTQEVVGSGVIDEEREPPPQDVVPPFPSIGQNLKQRHWDQRTERNELDLDDLDRRLSSIAPSAKSVEVSDYMRLPKMPDDRWRASSLSSFHAIILWNGEYYDWYEVTPAKSGGAPLPVPEGRSSKGAPHGSKTEPTAFHENNILNLPSNLLVRMFFLQKGSFGQETSIYVFQTTLEDSLPRSVLKSDPTGDEDEPSGSSWRVSKQDGGAGFILPISVGCAYKSDGDENLYGYFVGLEVSSDGRIVAVSSPQQYTINEPDACE